MSPQKSTSSKAVKGTAAVGSALAVAFVPQYADAGIITVGGDGGTGSVTLSNSFDFANNTGDATDIGGLLFSDLVLYSYSRYSSANDFGRYASLIGGERLQYSAARSSISTSGQGGAAGLTRWIFYSDDDFNLNGGAYQGAVLGSSDNWLPGVFNVNGVNGGNPIFGWLQVELGSSFGNFDPTIISFTYDDDATDATPFAKPVGGFSVDGTAVPEPTTLPLLTLLALGAGGLRRHRKCSSESSAAA